MFPLRFSIRRMASGGGGGGGGIWAAFIVYTWPFNARPKCVACVRVCTVRDGSTWITCILGSHHRNATPSPINYRLINCGSVRPVPQCKRSLCVIIIIKAIVITAE